MFSKKKKIRSEILLRVSAALLAAVLTVGTASFPEKSPVNSDTAVIVADAAYSKGEYKVSDSDGVNVRKGAGTKYGKVGAAAKGKKFTVTKISGDWGYTESIQCTNGKKAGWVCLKYCSKVKSDTSKAGTYKVYNCTGLNVRKKASTSSKIITTLKPGTKVVITSVSGNWGKIKAYGSTNCDGYVYMDYCKYVNNTVTVSAVNASTNAVKKVTNKNSTATAYVTPLINKNSYYISPACATKCVIDVKGSKTANKTNVLINTKSKAKSQKIKAVDAGDGYYVFYDTNSNKVLDVAGGKAANGTNVQIYKYNGTKSQKWRLVDAGDGYYESGDYSVTVYDVPADADNILFSCCTPDGEYALGERSIEVSSDGTYTFDGLGMEGNYTVSFMNGEEYLGTASFYLKADGSICIAEFVYDGSETSTVYTDLEKVTFNSMGAVFSYELGDVDFSGDIKVADLVIFRKYLVRNTSFNASQFSIADINNDAVLDVFDFTMLKKILLAAN